MISRKEYKILCKILNNPVDEEVIGWATYPDFMYYLHLEEYRNPKGKDNDELSYGEEEKLIVIGILLDRGLITRENKEFYVSNNEKRHFRYFKITDYGHNSIMEYKSKYRFWIPVGISLLALFISWLSLYENAGSPKKGGVAGEQRINNSIRNQTKLFETFEKRNQ